MSRKTITRHIKENHHRFHFFFVLILATAISMGIMLSSFRSSAQIAANPELPRTYINSAYPTLSSGRAIYSVRNSCGTVPNCYNSLQSAINQAILGDEIVIDANMVITGPITLPNKTAGSGWIVIRSANLANLPSQGIRVNPSNASDMPKILAPGSNEPALRTDPYAHHYRIVGIEFRKASPASVTDTLILAGDGSGLQNDVSLIPHDLIFDRIYVHGDPTSDLKRGLGLNSAYTAVVDSYFADIHGLGFDSQAIGGWNGTGPYKINNNYLEGAGENVLFGGSDPVITNLIPSDIEFRNNYLYKPRSWKIDDPSYAGYRWQAKNLFELKNGQRVLIEGNIFDGSWAGFQIGWAILFTVRNQDGNCTWCVVRDVTFQNNIVRHAASGLEILGHDDTFPSGLSERFKIYNNLWLDIDGARWGGGNGNWIMMLDSPSLQGPSDVQIIHNTFFHTGNYIYPVDYSDAAGYSVKPNTVITDNIGAHNDYGVIGGNAGVGDNSLNVYFPNGVFTRNILMGGPAGSYSQHPENYFPADWNSVFVDYSGGNYRVLPSSPYHLAGTDGRDLGVDFGMLDVATANVETGNNPNVPTPTPTPTPTERPPLGQLDSIDCAFITGWTFDQDTPNTAITTEIYRDGPRGAGGILIASGLTNVLRTSINSTYGITGNHGFNFAFPISLRDGNSHSFYAYGINTNSSGQNTLLPGSPSNLTCTSTVPTPTPTTTITPTPTPTSIPTPTPTIFPTPTPTPTTSSTPTAQAILPGVDWLTISYIMSATESTGGFLIVIGSILVGIVIILAGIMYVTSGGNPQRAAAAKNILKAGVIGALVIFGAGLIINTVRTFSENPLRFFQ